MTYLMLYVQSLTSDDGRTVRLKQVECCSKINLRYWASGWFYYRNILLIVVMLLVIHILLCAISARKYRFYSACKVHPFQFTL